jgi:NAD(P)-dependent dehydrogenase (short-subunit alcohol dehydrogenase family)
MTEISREPMSLEGRCALVTGGSRGLGREVAMALCRAGANIAILARPSAAFDDSFDGLQRARVAASQRVEMVVADLSDPGAPEAAVEAARRALGTIEILVNNAGIIGPMGTLDETDAAEWAHAMQINLLAPIALMRAVLPGMRAQRRGKIINMSGGGATSPRPHFTAYASAKTALVRVTETVAEEVRGLGIDINAVAPGAMNTRLLDQVLAAGPARVGDREYRRAVEQRENGGSPLARAADLIAWLASPESDGITGRVLSAVWDPWERLATLRDDLATSDIYTLRRIVPEDRGKDWGQPHR